MFVRYIEDKDVFACGFTQNPIMNETFFREKIDTKYLSTYMQVWMNINTYRYKVVTDREGAIEYGNISSKEILEELVSKFFENDKANFIRRNLSTIDPTLSETNCNLILASLQKMPEKELEKIIIKKFGENYDEIAA